MVQLPELLYRVVENVDGRRSYDEIAERVTETFGRGLSGENVQFLIDEKLRPLGVLAAADGSTPELQKVDPMLALRFRAALVPESAVRAITTVFYPLFFPPVILAVVAGLVAFDAWLFLSHGVAQAGRELLYQPLFVLLVLGLVVLSAAFHECGHATACRYGGAKPGVMGAGIYLVWPAFYTDVTDAYRLGKWGRLRTDLGGIYFNAIFILATAGAYFLTGFEPLLVLILFQHIEIVHQLMPFLRLDGYYIVSDLTGVPDMFSRIRPTLRSLLPWKEADDSVKELKPWVRVATNVYVLTLIPILLLVFGFMLVSTPRIFATAWDSFFVQLDKTSDAFGDGRAPSGIVGIVQMISIALPVGGISLTFAKLGRRLSTGAWNWTEGKPALRSAFALVAAALAGISAFVLWPNGEYKPIQPGERGTLQGAVAALEQIETGRPSLTPERERELGGAATRREQRNEDEPEPAPAPAEEEEEEPTATEPIATEPAATEPGGTETEPTETTDSPPPPAPEPAPPPAEETTETPTTSTPTETTTTTTETTETSTTTTP